MKDILSNLHVLSVMTSVIGRGNTSLGQAAFRSRKSMQIRIFSFFLGTEMKLATQSECCHFLTKLKSMSFLTSNSIAFMISGQNCHCYCLTGFAFELILRRCIGTKGSCPGISSKFQAKTSIYSCIRCTTSSFSEGSKLLLMKIGLGLDLLPKLIWVTLSSVDG